VPEDGSGMLVRDCDWRMIFWDRMFIMTTALVLIAAASFFRPGRSAAKKIQRKAGSRLQMADGNWRMAAGFWFLANSDWFLMDSEWLLVSC